MKSLARIAFEHGLDIVETIKVARKENLGPWIDDKKADGLAQIVGNRYSLTHSEQQRILDFVRGSECSDILFKYDEIYGFLTSDKQEELLRSIATQIIEKLPDDIQQKAQPEHIMTILNIGVVDVMRSGTLKREHPKRNFPSDIVKNDPVVWYRYGMRQIQDARTIEEVSGIITSIRGEVGSQHGGVLDSVIEKLENFIPFAQKFREKCEGIYPQVHQLIRIYDAIENERQRILIADTTSAGKTLSALAIKTGRDLKYGRRRKVVVFAPNQALYSAWTSEEINRQAKSLPIKERPDIGTYDVRILTRDTIATIDQADIVLVNYDKLGLKENPNENDYFRKVKEVVENADGVIFDEAHNLKNICTNRARAAQDLVAATIGKAVTILTASPVPNDVKDVGFMLYLLNPLKYARYGTEEFDPYLDPHAIRDVLISEPWFSFGRQDIKEIFNLPELTIKDPIGVQLKAEAAQEYLNVWTQRGQMGPKMIRLRQILLESKVDRLVEEIIGSHQRDPSLQMAVFTQLKEHFLDLFLAKLKEKQPDMAVRVIEGETEMQRRIDYAREFREGKIPLIVCMEQCAGEGIPLTTGERQGYIIIAEPMQSPGAFDQLIGRMYRFGQSGPVSIVEMVAHSWYLEKNMPEEKAKLEQKGVRFRATWEATTTDQDNLNKRREKEGRISKALSTYTIANILDAFVESDEIGETEKNGEKDGNRRQISPNKLFIERVNRVRQSIGRSVDHLLNNPHLSDLVLAYGDRDWIDSSSADTNRMVVKVIETLEKKNGRQYGNILDWGCGPACLQQILGRPITNIDASSAMIEEGRRITNGKGTFVVSDIKDYNIRPKSFDIITSIYSLQYNGQGFEHKRDIEQILFKTNKSLIKKGYAIFGLPNQATSKDDFETLTKKLLPSYGFDVIFADFVLGQAPEGINSRERNAFQGAYLLVAQKKREADWTENTGEIIDVYSPFKPVGVGGTARGKFPCMSKQPSKKLPATHFIVATGGFELTAALEKYI